MRFVFQSLAPQPGLTNETLVEAAEELRAFLTEDPVLKAAAVGAFFEQCALGIQATVYSKPEVLAKMIALSAADDAWARALAECGCQTDGRTGVLGDG